MVLYRKYRPKALSEMVGQEPIVQTMAATLKKGSVPHALLLTGRRGVGKTSLARILAHQLNEVPYDEQQTYLDIIEIDAASHGRIDEVRNLQATTQLAPMELTYKVYIIDEVHMLTKDASNALLKTLEEPPTNVIFILATTEMHKVLPTIVSRCQHFALRAIAELAMVDYLQTIAKKEKLRVDEAALQLVAQHADGSLRDALSLLDQLASLNQKIDAELVSAMLGLPPKEQMVQLLQALQAHDFKTVVAHYRQLIATGVDAVLLAAQLSQQLRADLLNEKSSDTIIKTIKLLEDLLAVGNAKRPQTTLEVVLLKHTQKED